MAGGGGDLLVLVGFQWRFLVVVGFFGWVFVEGFVLFFWELFLGDERSSGLVLIGWVV